jgi:hypothetical protein
VEGETVFEILDDDVVVTLGLQDLLAAFREQKNA